jgi:hypothetical protein
MDIFSFIQGNISFAAAFMQIGMGFRSRVSDFPIIMAQLPNPVLSIEATDRRSEN